MMEYYFMTELPKVPSKNMNETQKHAEWKNLDTKEDKICDFVSTTFIGEEMKLIHANRNQVSGWVGQEVGDGNVH